MVVRRWTLLVPGLLLVKGWAPMSSPMTARLTRLSARKAEDPGALRRSVLVAPLVFSTSALAAADCTKDCVRNCIRVAPGNEEYCRAECDDYCAQPDREDGLSGSISADKGYVGLSSPLGGTVEYGQDRPPAPPGVFKDLLQPLDDRIRTLPPPPSSSNPEL